MARSVRLKIVLDGEIASAISWEAERRGMPPQALARDLLASSGAKILSAWHEGRRRAPSAAGTRPAGQQVQSVEAVLRKSYGPADAVGHGRPVGGEKAAGIAAPGRSARRAGPVGAPRPSRPSDRGSEAKSRLR